MRKYAHKLTMGDTESEVFTCRYDPSDKYIACGYGEGSVRVYDAKDGKCAHTLANNINLEGKTEDMPITDIRWRPTSSTNKTSNILVSASADGWLRHWHVPSGKCFHSYKCQDDDDQQIYSIDFNADGNSLATVGKDKIVRIYDEQTKALVLRMKENGDQLPGHSNRVFALRFNPYNPNMLVSGGWDNTLQIYDVRKRGPVAAIYGPHICGDAIDFKDDGVTIIAGSYRDKDSLEVYDLREYEKVRNIEWDGLVEQPPVYVNGKKLPRDAPFIYSCLFNNTTSQVIAGGAGANEVRVFDFKTGALISAV